MCRAWIAIATGALAACGDNLTDVPADVSVGDVTIETDPLVLVVKTPLGELRVERFVEVAVATSVDPMRYYDPRDIEPAAFSWRVAERAVAHDPDRGLLRLDTGATLSLAPGPVPGVVTLTVDAGPIDGAVLVRLVLPRDPDEPIYGFGENLVSAEAGGTVREMQLRIELDSESSLNETHVPVPLTLWPARGAGVFIEDPRPGAFDIGVQRADRVLATFTLASPGPLAAHLYGAGEPLELLRRYVDLTAPPALPPRWAFAPQQWRNVHNSSQEVVDDANRMRAEAIPGSAMWIDNPWQTAYNDFTIDETRLSGSAAMLAELAALGYRVIVWSTPYVNRDGPTAGDFADAAAAGHLVAGPNGQPFVFPWQDGPGALVDFSAPGATDWWRERIARITARGISGFKLDFGEDLVPNIGTTLTPWTLAGGTPQTLHNQYARLYHEAYLGALPEGDGFVITRAGAYGEQAVNTCIWPGDLDSDFSRHGVDNGEGQLNVGGLPAAIAAGLSLSVSGYPFYGSDIGGFRDGPPTTETLIRWAQYAALGTIMQLGGGGQSHNPWDSEQFEPVALDIYRTYARLHMDLFPMIYTLATRAAADGTPVTRPARFLFPDTLTDDAAYLIGDALFVAPVVDAGARSREVVLPPGVWIDWWTGEAMTGDGRTERTIAAPLDILPLWRRENAIVAMFSLAADTLEPATTTSVRSYAQRDIGRELRLMWRPTGESTSIALWDGTTAAAAASGPDYTVTLSAGSEFDIVTVDIDGRAATSGVDVDGNELANVADETALAACPAPGCALWEAPAGRLRARVHLRPSSATELRIRP